VDNLKKLQDEAVALANRIDAVRAIESTDADKIAERDLELEALNAEYSFTNRRTVDSSTSGTKAEPVVEPVEPWARASTP